MKRFEIRYEPEDYEPEPLTDNGGELFVIEGKNTSGDRSTKNRRIRVRHYANNWNVHVGIGPANKEESRASIQLDVNDTEELIVCLCIALAEANKSFENRG